MGAEGVLTQLYSWSLKAEAMSSFIATSLFDRIAMLLACVFSQSKVALKLSNN